MPSGMRVDIARSGQITLDIDEPGSGHVSLLEGCQGTSSVGVPPNIGEDDVTRLEVFAGFFG